MKTSLFFPCLVLALLACAVLPGCGGSPTESNPPPPPVTGDLLLSKISVAVVPGMSETVQISEEDGSVTESYSVRVDSPGVATATVTGSLLTIKGSRYGSAQVTVTNSKGVLRTIPVRVYNPNVVDTGELILAFVDQFSHRGHYTSYFSGTGSFWQPVTDDGFKALGAMCISGYYNPSGAASMMVVKAIEGSDALAPPVDYVRVYSGGFGSCWRPVPPSGYVALGMVVHTSFDLKPSLNDVVCVRKDLTMKAEAGPRIYRIGNNSGSSFMAWHVLPPDAGDLEDALLPSGTFVGLGDIYGNLTEANRPLSHAVMNVLKVRLPLLSEAPPQAYQPKLEGFDEPPLTTVPVFARAMLVPFNIVLDPRYPGDPKLRVRNSPTYRLEREVFYKRIYHSYNQGSQVQTNNVSMESGITTTESDRYWSETGVSVTVEAGINFKVFSAKVSATVSKAFGYEQQRSIAVLQAKTVSSSINIAPGKAGALWQKFNRFVLKRHNGTELETVDVSEFGIDSYVIDEYPDNSGDPVAGKPPGM